MIGVYEPGNIKADERTAFAAYIAELVTRAQAVEVVTSQDTIPWSEEAGVRGERAIGPQCVTIRLTP